MVVVGLHLGAEISKIIRKIKVKLQCFEVAKMEVERIHNRKASSVCSNLSAFRHLPAQHTQWSFEKYIWQAYLRKKNRPTEIQTMSVHRMDFLIPTK